MNGGGKGDAEAVNMEEEIKGKLVYMWGYLPGALPQRSPLTSPVAVRVPPTIGSFGDSWKDVCGGGCGFAMAISESGKLITWGSTDDLGQSYVTSGKHGETPESFPLPTEASIVKAASGWAHCVAVTESGEVYTWGWKECVPSGRVFVDPTLGGCYERDALERQSSFLTEQVSPPSQGSRSTGETVSGIDARGGGEENTKRRRVSSAKQAAESSSSGDETLSAFPCLVTLNPGVRIAAVAAGGRHTLALSDAGALLTFGWGLYGQCGQGGTDDELSPACVSSLLGIRIEGVAAGLWHTVCISADGDVYSFGGNQFGQLGTGADQAETLPRLLDAPSLENMHAKFVSCGARHSAIITEDRKVFCWGWNKYGQLGLGDVIDRNIPSQVIIDGCIPENVYCGWWHTLLLAESPT
ncbi:ultraviolet-B receptor UVR8-like isoform X4 [Juglans microcarpa x Juglans regia]|uniref:ultraviolet-B receptor UVR8-like isoform X4 n=1 Tax=Juglans microcarpa x Juglans regia TaxID=2249226 RepID=UPI001B7E1607|nr:ultraviolet-B receptor UVR8-like isoform X4 [Juglans microcarpa x Juglans regia]